MKIQAGTKIQEKYVIEHLLGEGSSSFVYKAHDFDLNKEMALKFLRPELASLPPFRSRFLREAKLMAQLKHPNIVAIRAISEWNKILFLAMDYHGNLTLKDLLAARKLQKIEIQRLSYQLLNALHESHKLGLVHGDIKPANIMIHGEKENISLTLIDFGLGTLQNNEITKKQGKVSGTPYYMAPEQILGTPSNPLTDLYSSAVCIYQMITSRLPFHEKQTQSFLSCVLQEEIPFASHFRKVPLRMDKVLAKALSIASEDRYQSAGEFQKALETAWKSKMYRGFLPWIILILCIVGSYFLYTNYFSCPVADKWYEQAEQYLENKQFLDAKHLAEKTISYYPAPPERKWFVRLFLAKKAKQEYNKACSIFWQALWLETQELLEKKDWDNIYRIMKEYKDSKNFAIQTIFETLCLYLYIHLQTGNIVYQEKLEEQLTLYIQDKDLQYKQKNYKKMLQAIEQLEILLQEKKYIAALDYWMARKSLFSDTIYYQWYQKILEKSKEKN